MRFLRTAASPLLLAIAATACNATGLAVTPSPDPAQPPTPTNVPAQPQDLATEPPAETTEPPTATPAPQPLRVAYVLDGNLWGLELGSAPVQLTGSGLAVELQLSADGEQLAYLEWEPTDNRVELRAVGFDGNNDRSLLDQAGFDALYPLDPFIHYAPSQLTVLPSTHQLLFNTRGVLVGPGLAKNDDLLRIDLDTGQLTKLLPRGEGGDFTVSPDGEQLAIVRPDSLGFARSGGSQLRPEVLTFPRVITYSEYFYYPLPVWVGEGVIAAIPAEDPFFGPQRGSVWQLPLDGSDPILLASVEGDLFAPQSSTPLVSTDGSQLAFYHRPEASGSVELWFHDIDSGGETLYTRGPLDWRGWAPNSNHFMFQDQSTRELVLGRLGAAPTALGGARVLHWTEPGTYLRLLEMTDGSWRLELSDVDGTTIELAEIRGDFGSSDFAD